MSDRMQPIPFGHLMNWCLNEYAAQKSIFGVSKLTRRADGQALPIFAEKIETPFGPAAGPNTQLAQNILAAYAAGARFFELKTVQVIDGEDLAKCVARPCIAAGDECYNCEWSTELTVPQAYAEYVKAWFACKLLAKELPLGDPDAFVFNMSVGYDLAGIRSEKIDNFIEGMKSAANSDVFNECRSWALANVGRFAKVDAAYIEKISAKISDSITLSTLHGCPPDEIERIATYLIEEKNLNTYVKCNPTLLGYEFARQRLDSLGFDYVTFDDHHFKEDLQWADAVPMFRRLQKRCDDRGLEFGLKLTNTFPVDVAASELPSQEMYMSGRALFPLTIALAKKISDEFAGKLRISYSGGATRHNSKALFDAGIWPITMATNILKPGGYQRFHQIAEVLGNCGSKPFVGVDIKAVAALEQTALTDPRYRKPIKGMPNHKIGKKVPLLDCFTAPCRGGCPIEQDIPAYLAAVGEGRYADALGIILQRNPLPFITGTICPHHCADKCMRGHYEESVHIRAAKLQAATEGFAAVLPTLHAAAPVTGKKVAIVGGGPAGLAAAAFLSRAGVTVTVFEESRVLGGVVRRAIPAFRITDASIDQDLALCKAYGAEFRLGERMDSPEALLAEGYTDVILAIGAWKAGNAGLKYGTALDALDFLTQAKADPASLKLGSDVVVIGGGNTAMDVARAAKLIPGVAKVRLVYRRTRRYMPADEEELNLALADGIEFKELLAPIGEKDGVLTCSVMELGAPDASGRRSPVDTGKTVELPATTVITAVGEKIDPALFESCGAKLDAKGRPVVGEGMDTSAAHIYAVGDARRGPATVVEAIADAAKAAAAIAGITYDAAAPKNVLPDAAPALAKKGDVCDDYAHCTETRCLGCATVCEVCTDVCPNRANVAIQVPGLHQPQILHMDGMCNSCGNCAVFCPYESRPYQDKFTLYWSREAFEDSTNEGVLPLAKGMLVRLDGKTAEYDPHDPNCGLPEDIRLLLLALKNDYAYLINQ